MQAPGSTVDRRALLLALAGSGLIAACKPAGTPRFVGADITGAPYAKGFTLSDVDGQTRTLADFQGQVAVVFFGFTQCPDVCPSTLGELALVKAELGESGKRVRPIFITVDPERDTAAVLKAYVANFGPDTVALRGTPEQTAAVAKDFKVFYAKVPGKTADSYTVDHTAASFLFDAQGRVRVYARYGSGPQALKSDLLQLLNEAR